MYRLLDSAEFKATLDRYHADLALITSHDLHRQLIHDGPGLIDPDTFTPIEITTKETTGPAWVWLPPLIPHPPTDPTLLTTLNDSPAHHGRDN